MTTDTPAAPHRRPGSGTAPPPPKATSPRPWRPRGRHRRTPRSRKLLLGAGGLALAVGVLSLVRLVPDPGTGGSGVAQAAPSYPAPAMDPAPVTTPAPDGGTAPGTDRPGSSAPSAIGGLRASTASGRPPVPAPNGTTPDAGRGTVIPALPDTPGIRVPSTAPGEPDGPRPAAPRPPRTESPAPRPPSAPAPAPSSPTPSPEPDRTGLCVPVIGLCLGFTDGDG
ncbi:hypothetical protein SUDANB6_02241 [Streptomyces sp. enrichment culture]